MPPLPVELIEEIIDIVAECCPESLPSCAMVSSQWLPRSTRHLYRIFRTPTITTSGTLHAFFDIVKRHPRLAALATSLQVAPDPEFNSADTTYIPFHQLSSRVLPNVRRLSLGKTLRWGDYPLVYRKGIAGFFSEVVTIDLSCHFSSISDLFRVLRSFKNIKDVRLIYPHHVPPRWMLDQRHIPLIRRAFSQETFKLQNLELSLPILKPILDVCGNSVVNLSVLCPQMSAVSTDAVEDDQRLAFACSLASLQTVKIAVPVESDDPTNHAGLEKLSRLLITPITKPGVRYSLFLVRCPIHNAVGFRVADTSIAGLQRHIGILVETNPPMEECQDCWKRNNTVGQEDRSGTGYGRLMPPAPPFSTLARSKLQQYTGSHSLHRWTLLKNSIVRSHPVDPPPPEADVDVVYRPHNDNDDDDDARDEEVEEDTFMFPVPYPLGSHSADGGPSENHWLDSLLEDLGDDNNNYASDVESPRAPSSLPVDEDDDDGPYPPIHPLLLPSGLQSHSVVHDPLPDFDADDDDDDRFCVPDAVEDTSDDESDALLTPYSEPTSLPGDRFLSIAFGGDEFA